MGGEECVVAAAGLRLRATRVRMPYESMPVGCMAARQMTASATTYGVLRAHRRVHNEGGVVAVAQCGRHQLQHLRCQLTVRLYGAKSCNARGCLAPRQAAAHTARQRCRQRRLQAMHTNETKRNDDGPCHGT